jgi:hypothetical protein
VERLQTHTIEQIVNHILERMIFRFFPEPIIPCKAVAHDEATQDIVRAEYTDYAEGKESEGYAKCKEGLVIDKPGVRFRPGSRV